MERKINEVLESLKKKFVGLDETIDKLGQMITPWLLTPEIITRPVVISLWGMTGTGKSSLIRKMIEELGYLTSTMFFDCGECTSESNSLVSNICDTFGLKDGMDDVDDNIYKLPHPILVFDEFQYAKTIDEDGKEVINSSIRPIWYMLDSGIVDITDNYSWTAAKTLNFIKKFIPFANMYPNIKLVKGKMIDQVEMITYKQMIGDKNYDLEEDEDQKSFYVLDSDYIKQCISSLNSKEKGLGYKFVNEYYKSDMSILDLAKWLEIVKQDLCIPKILDLSNALVFVIGNLDEAYRVDQDLNPDLDADIFYDITSKVTLNDIKIALKTRFRAEQVARLGNNMILYPTLRSNDFKKVINQEVDRVLEDFNKVWKGTITVTSNFKDLLYSEGVFPVQGVRPVFTTINSFLFPLLSKVLTNFKEDESVTIDVTTDDFKVNSVDIEIKSVNNILRIEQKLQLGELRNPKNRKKRYICSVHEMGHAILFAYLTGNIPDRIVSVSTDKGGFCSTYDKNEEGEISSRRNIDNEVMISLGGYLAEDLIYKNRQDMCLLGSMSDLRLAWCTFSEAAYNLGYFNPLFYTSLDVDSGLDYGLPNGADSERPVQYFNGHSFTEDRISLNEAITKRMSEFTKEVKLILEANIDLLKKGALILGEKGIMLKDEFNKLIENNNSRVNRSLSLAKMRETKEILDPEYYWKALL